MKLSLKDIDIKGKKVLVRLDLNVPIVDGKITDDTRIKESLPTIKYITEKGSCVIMAHLGRPKGKDPALSLEPVAKRLQELLSTPACADLSAGAPAQAEASAAREVTFVDDCLLDPGLMKPGQVALLENLRFYKEEVKDDKDFAWKLATGKDVYVNDGFGVSHRPHASVHAITQYFDKPCAGFLMEKEISYLGKLLTSPERPFVAILGGAKVSDKISLVQNLLKNADLVLIGGAMAYTILKAQGKSVGDSLVEENNVEAAKSLASSNKLILPIDHKLHDGTCSDEIKDTMKAFDIGPKTIDLFKKKLRSAKSILWNGPVGLFEKPEFETGTNEIAHFIVGLNCVKVAGGGDTASALEKFGVKDRFTHISTGGGACIEFLAGKELPGIAVLKEK